jgi:hypothetical protein
MRGGRYGSARRCRSGRLSVAVVFGEGLLDSCRTAFTSGAEEQREQVGVSCLKSRVAKSRGMRWARMMVNHDQSMTMFGGWTDEVALALRKLMSQR